MPRIDPEACPASGGTRYPDPYRDPVRARRWRRIGAGAGLTDFGANLVTLPPGVWSSQKHWHPDDDELLVMLAGEATLVEGDARTPLGAGDIVAWAKGDPTGHHLVNESDGDARFLVIGRNEGGAEYPDIDLSVRAGEDFYRHADGTPYRPHARDE